MGEGLMGFEFLCLGELCFLLRLSFVENNNSSFVA